MAAGEEEANVVLHWTHMLSIATLQLAALFHGASAASYSLPVSVYDVLFSPTLQLISLSRERIHRTCLPPAGPIEILNGKLEKQQK